MMLSNSDNATGKRKGWDMKKLTWLVVLVLVVSVAMAACKKKTEVVEEEVTITEKVVEGTPVDKIVGAISGPFCKRMIACTTVEGQEQFTMKEDECVAQIGASLAEAIKDKPVKVSDDDIKKCVDCLNGTTGNANAEDVCSCNGIMKDEPPAPCAFLK